MAVETRHVVATEIGEPLTLGHLRALVSATGMVDKDDAHVHLEVFKATPGPLGAHPGEQASVTLTVVVPWDEEGDS